MEFSFWKSENIGEKNHSESRMPPAARLEAAEKIQHLLTDHSNEFSNDEFSPSGAFVEAIFSTPPKVPPLKKGEKASGTSINLTPRHPFFRADFKDESWEAPRYAVEQVWFIREHIVRLDVELKYDSAVLKHIDDFLIPIRATLVQCIEAYGKASGHIKFSWNGQMRVSDERDPMNVEMSFSAGFRRGKAHYQEIPPERYGRWRIGIPKFEL